MKLLRDILCHEYKKWRARRRPRRVLKPGEKLRARAWTKSGTGGGTGGGKTSGTGKSKWTLGCQQGWRCGECYGLGIFGSRMLGMLGMGRLPVDVDVDHIVPVSQGGWDDEANVQILCPSCHAFKTRHSDIRKDTKTIPECLS
jgi:5-methylcytosine-specific restriction endonuclease McrA